MTSEPTRVQLKRMASCTLGKMVQPSAGDGHVQAPYLRAAHVQPNGRVIELPEQPMWFSSAELKALTLRHGDVVVVEGGAGYGRSAVLHQDLDGWGFQNSIVRIRPNPDRADGRFIDYAIQAALLSGEIESSVSTATIPHFTAEKVARLPIADIRASNQRAIADFLDRETAQIDAFIAKNEELITLLAERRSAVTAELGLEHVGTGPRLKHHLREIDVRAGSLWSDLPLLSVSIAWGVRRRDEVTQDAPQASDLSGYKVAERGDIVLNRMRAFQGALGVSPIRGLVSPDYAVLRSRGAADAHWLAHVMKTPRFVGEMTSRLKGIGGTESGAVRTPRINVADLSDIRVGVPSAALQAAGVDQMVAALESIDGAIATAGRAIDLARERRAALISAAVTGKIDVGVSA